MPAGAVSGGPSSLAAAGADERPTSQLGSDTPVIVEHSGSASRQCAIHRNSRLGEIVLNSQIGVVNERALALCKGLLHKLLPASGFGVMLRAFLTSAHPCKPELTVVGEIVRDHGAQLLEAVVGEGRDTVRP